MKHKVLFAFLISISVLLTVLAFGNKVEVIHTTLENNTFGTQSTAIAHTWEGTPQYGDHISITVKGILPIKVCWSSDQWSQILQPGMTEAVIIERFFLPPVKIGPFWMSCE